LNENIKQMKNVVSRMPKSINESIYFEDDDMMDGNEELITDDEGMEDNHMEKQEETGLNVTQFVDDIRKKSLRGMAQLADNPDSEEYQLLKKIWQICDKKPEQQNGMNMQNKPMQRNM